MTDASFVGCVLMIVNITTSGGLGGFGVAKSATVKVDELAEPLKAQTCAQLEPKLLAKMTKDAPTGAADAIIYHIVITGKGDKAHKFDVSELAMPEAMIDLMDTLLDPDR